LPRQWLSTLILAFSRKWRQRRAVLGVAPGCRRSHRVRLGGGSRWVSPHGGGCGSCC